VDPRDFLHLARAVAATGTAAGHRTATSRAYYAAYHVAFDFLLALGFRVPRGHFGHDAVQRRLVNASLDPVIHAGTLLRRLQNVRVRADYWLRDKYPEDPATAAFWLERAAEIVRALDAAAADPAARARMTAAIQAWEHRQPPGAR
jgi:uncharacterized protein (UPF0332 family)